MRAVDLFSGPGGLAIGLRAAGIEPYLCVEKNRDAIETYARHHSECSHFNEDIQSVDFSPYKGKVDIVFGGPPCQPFSLGGLRKCWEDNRDMVPQFLRCIDEIKPYCFLMENVIGLVQKKAKPYFTSLIEEFMMLGYEVNWAILNSSEYGVPQNRKRVIVLGCIDKLLLFPKPTHGQNEGLLPIPKSKDFLPYSDSESRPKSPVKYASYPDLRPSPYGGHVYNGGGRPIDPNAPSHTIYASAGGYKTHWIDTLGVAPEYHQHLINGGKPREGEVPGALRLSIKESAIIQTFPDNLEFAGSKSSQYTQVGDAVPPVLAEALGKAICSQFHGSTNENDFLQPDINKLLLQSTLKVLAA